jgi:DNA-binding PucR family transcriptional regulator
MELSDREKVEAVKEFDQEFIIDKSRPLSPAERAQWERAKAKRGRPVNGRGAKAISVSMEMGLLAEFDALARKMRVTRSALMARSMRRTLAIAGKNGR